MYVRFVWSFVCHNVVTVHAETLLWKPALSLEANSLVSSERIGRCLDILYPFTRFFVLFALCLVFFCLFFWVFRGPGAVKQEKLIEIRRRIQKSTLYLASVRKPRKNRIFQKIGLNGRPGRWEPWSTSFDETNRMVSVWSWGRNIFFVVFCECRRKELMACVRDFRFY